MRNIQNWHMDHNGWADIGYNFLVDRYGTIWEGRGWGALGAHCQGHNSDYLGIAYMGEDDVTPAALGAIAWLLEMARTRHQVGPAVKPHNALGSTSCPGPRLTTWVNAGCKVEALPAGKPRSPSPKPRGHPTTVSLGARGPRGRPAAASTQREEGPPRQEHSWSTASSAPRPRPPSSASSAARRSAQTASSARSPGPASATREDTSMSQFWSKTAQAAGWTFAETFLVVFAAGFSGIIGDLHALKALAISAGMSAAAAAVSVLKSVARS